MRAQILTHLCELEIEGQPRRIPELPLKTEPLQLTDVPVPVPDNNEILIKVKTCGVCHTELDEIEGRRIPKLPVIPGHEVVGIVEKLGQSVTKHKIGDRVGVGWIFSSCLHYPPQFPPDKENLCDDFKATGCDADGGYAEYMVIGEDYAYKIPDIFSDSNAAPLMCAGGTGYRSLKLTKIKNGDTLGLFGFGASAHIIIQVARYKYPDSKIYVFTRSNEHRKLSMKLGAEWAGNPDDLPPEKIDRAIDFTPVGETITKALRVLQKGGRLVINAIRKRNKIELDYTKDLWYEKEVKSVANVTRKDISDFLPLAAEIPILTEIREFKLEEANEALRMLKAGRIQGAAVLRI
jgi:propanol-preferring alcohol dehydrogenase